MALATACSGEPTAKAEPPALLVKGYDEIGKGDFEGAVSTLSAAVKADPNSVNARRYLAYALTKNGESGDALNQIAIVKKMAPVTAFDDIILGESYLALARYKEAEDSFREALKLEAKSDAARGGMIRSLALLLQWDKAIYECREGLRLAQSTAQKKYYQSLYEGLLAARLKPNTTATGQPLQASGAIIALPPRQLNKLSGE